jgi:D-xylose transport system ATP-binding protein
VTDPILELSGISKQYGRVQALSDVSLEVRAGEVVALVGDNGAGKSTLVKVIAGVAPADSGEIYWQGNHVAIRNPHVATALGIATVYQDLALCDNLDVVANLFLGHEVVRSGVLDEIGMERRAQNLLAELDVKLPNPRVPVSALSGGQRQSVAIARAKLGSPKLVILDEPTAALSVPQTSQVLDLINKLRDDGLGVIMISHNLNNVKAVANRVVVLRLGHNAGEFVINKTTKQSVVQEIVRAITSGPFTTSVSRRRSMDGGAISITEARR